MAWRGHDSLEPPTPYGASAEPEPIDAPAAAPPAPARMPLSIVAIIAPLLFAGAMVAYLGQAIYALFALLSPVMAIGTWLESRQRNRRATGTGSRQFAAELNTFRAALDDRVQAETERRRLTLPHPAELLRWAAAPSTRLWERRPQHDDFLQLHGGIGTFAWQPTLTTSGGKLPAEVDKVLAEAGLLHAVPIPVDLVAGRVVGVVGDRPAALALARSLVLQATTLSGPADLRVAVLTDSGRVDEWEWAKWLPHTADASGAHGRHLTCDAQASNAVLRDLLAAGKGATTPTPPGPVTLVVLDAESVGTNAAASIPPDRPGRGVARVGAGKLVAFQAAQLRTDPALPSTAVEIRPFGFRTERSPAAGAGPIGDPATALAKVVTAVDAAFAASGLERPRQLWSGDAPAEVPLETVDLPGLLGIDDVGTLEPGTWWQSDTTPSLKVPVGLTLARQPLHLDLKESALGGMGPHGLVVGATGSGKSEFLRTLVGALAITHAPEHLSFVLVDFKGGAAFAGLAALPHVAGMITNLENDLALVDRMYDALFGEQRRRQELLRAAGALASVHDYQKLRATGVDLEPLPSLLIIVDEFAELLTAKPDFIDLFVSIGRLGRSLGMHLLLSSQRLEEGRLRGLESHIRYRIGLRTFSAQDSRAVLGVPDAYELPSEPGVGYLKVDTTTFTRFKGALISVPYTAPHGREPNAGSVLDVVVSRLSGAPPVHQVWLPPLAPVTLLDQLLPGLTVDPQRGLTATGWHGIGRLVVPVGVADRPAEQRRAVVEIDAGGTSGNLVIAGAPQTGKTTLLRTFVTAFALTHTPTEAQFYCIDYGGGGLAALAGLPHVGSVASRLEPDKVRRLIAEVDGIMARREELFREHSIDSVASLRALRHAGGLPDEQLADVFLVIDNWPALRRTFEDLEEVVLDVAARGLGYGIHVVITVNRWLDLRGNLRDSLGGILELRLADTGESLVDRKIASNVPTGAPGRGLVREKLHFQTAVPRIDGKINIIDLQVGIEDLVARVASSIDYRRTLLETVEPDYLGFSDVTAAQLRARNWWQGPDYYLVVDDYDLVATANNPLSRVLEFVAQGRDLGFHLILARRVAGAQRALFEPVLQQVKELGNPGLILSGDRGEGPLLGTSRATTFPPGRGLLIRRKEQPVRVQVAWTQ
ncbi:MAG: type VII secretion protein EccCa [Pseudonocardiaceae bacterium]